MNVNLELADRYVLHVATRCYRGYLQALYTLAARQCGCAQSVAFCLPGGFGPDAPAPVVATLWIDDALAELRRPNEERFLRCVTALARAIREQGLYPEDLEEMLPPQASWSVRSEDLRAIGGLEPISAALHRLFEELGQPTLTAAARSRGEQERARQLAAQHGRELAERLKARQQQISAEAVGDMMTQNEIFPEVAEEEHVRDLNGRTTREAVVEATLAGAVAASDVPDMDPHPDAIERERLRQLRLRAMPFEEWVAGTAKFLESLPPRDRDEED